MTRYDDIYMAGYFDGEGTLSIQRAFGAAKDRRYHFMTCAVSSTNKAILDWMAETYGGSVSPHKVKDGHKAAWRWQVRSQQAEDFLRRIQPYLREKQMRANLALEFRATIQPRGGMVNGRRGTATHPVTVELEDERERLRLAIKALNQRGVEQPLPSSMDLPS